MIAIQRRDRSITCYARVGQLQLLSLAPAFTLSSAQTNNVYP